MAEQDRKSVPVMPTGTEEPGNIDRIRDILFGNNIRDYDRRFVQLEDRLNAELADIRNETRRLFASLEAFVRDEVKSLLEQLKTEQTDRAEACGTLEREMEKLAKRTSKDEDVAAAALRESRQALLDQTKALHEEILTASKTLADSLKRESLDLRSAKTDRAALAAVLNEMAVRISGDNGPEK
jgi:rRNA-processing protein FCF1